MAIIVGIDGTGGAFIPGVTRDAEYDIAFRNSFVRRISHNRGANAHYLRGPVALGGGLVAAINDGYNFIIRRHASDVTEPILLTGYSRGAAGIVALAKKLKNARKDVRAILMFDCVDRHLVVDSEFIPNNIGHVMHVMRSPNSGSRESFDNDGLKYSSPTIYPTPQTFMCTHGGMGGCPWPTPIGSSPRDLIDEGLSDGLTNITYLQDAQVSTTVWTSVMPFMTTHGFI